MMTIEEVKRLTAQYAKLCTEYEDAADEAANKYREMRAAKIIYRHAMLEFGTQIGDIKPQ